MPARICKRGGHHMSKRAPADRDVIALFRKLNLPSENSPPALTDFGRTFDPTAAPATPGVEYRTILTNGTGKAVGSGNAQLE